MRGIERKGRRCSPSEIDVGINMMADVEIKLLPKMQTLEAMVQIEQFGRHYHGLAFTDSKQ